MDANELRGQPRLPLQRAVDWILSECGSKIWDDHSVYIDEDDGDGDKFRNYSKEYSAAALRAVNELLGKIHDGQLKARGYADGEATLGRKEIPADEFPDTATDSPYGVLSLKALLPSDQPKRHLVFEGSAQLRYFRTVYWSEIVLSGDDVLRLWPAHVVAQSNNSEADMGGVVNRTAPRPQRRTKSIKLSEYMRSQFDCDPGKSVEEWRRHFKLKSMNEYEAADEATILRACVFAWPPK